MTLEKLYDIELELVIPVKCQFLSVQLSLTPTALLLQVGQAEEFMSQYGYRPATRMDTELLLDWGRQPAPVATVAPPAASEFCEEAAEGECPAPALLSPAPAPVLSTDSPTIFDIGLSKQSLNLMLQNKPRLEGAAVNTAITAKFDTASHTEKSVNQNHDRLGCASYRATALILLSRKFWQEPFTFWLFPPGPYFRKSIFIL